MAYGKKTGGRHAGTPNKVTAESRQAVAAFVDGNAHRLNEWLDSVANGVRDADNNFIVLPNPGKAFQLFQSIMEYHIPKLGRIEVAGTDAQSPTSDNQLGIFEELIKNLKILRQSE